MMSSAQNKEILKMKFYKYLSSQNAKKILENMCIAFSNVNEFNDPFEVSYKTSLESALENIDGELKNKITDSIVLHDAKKNRFREGIIDNFHVFCGSRVWNNLLMWAHYADKYYGVVLGFGDSASFLNTRYLGCHSEMICEHNNNIDVKSIKNFHVMYSNERPDCKIGTPQIELIKWKSREWSYEEEWRVVLYDPKSEKNEYGKVKFETIDKNDLKEIILGPRIKEDEYEEYISIAKKNFTNVNIYRTKLAVDKFDIEKTSILKIDA